MARNAAPAVAWEKLRPVGSDPAGAMSRRRVGQSNDSGGGGGRGRRSLWIVAHSGWGSHANVRASPDGPIDNRSAGCQPAPRVDVQELD